MFYQHVVPAQTTVTGLYYRDVLKVLQGHIRWKRPCLRATSWMLHHNNARQHVAECLAQINVKCVSHPPSSPDLVPCDFFLLPNLKKHLRGRRFQSSEAVVRAAEAVLKDLSKMVSSMSLQTGRNAGTSALLPTEPTLRRTINILRMSKSMLTKKRSFFIEQPT